MDDFALQKVAEFVAVPACSRIRDEDRCRYAGAGAGGWRGCELIVDSAWSLAKVIFPVLLGMPGEEALVTVLALGRGRRHQLGGRRGRRIGSGRTETVGIDWCIALALRGFGGVV